MPVKVTRNTTVNADKRKDDLRMAAYRLFRDHGYDETTVDQIAAEANASKGSFYWHYASKQDVFLDILAQWTREIIDQMYAQFLGALGSADSIGAMTEALEREIRRGRVIVPVWLDFAVHARKDPALRDALGQFYQHARAATAEILRPALAGKLDEQGIQGVAATVFGGYLGLLVQELADPQGADAKLAVQAFMGLLRGISAN